MDIFKKYQEQTRTEAEPGKCGDCANAIWRILRAGVPNAYDTASNGSITCHCTAVGQPITHIVYNCSAYAQSDAAQGAELAGML